MSLLPYVLAIGINDPSVADLEPLEHADDDAAAFIEMFGARWERTRLLANFDRESRELFPGYAEEARPPTKRELLRAVKELGEAIDRDAEKPIVLISIGGHAVAGASGHVELLLADGSMSQQALLDEVIAPLSRAHRVHLFVDTCHAAALIRPRAKVEEADEESVRKSFLGGSLARFGNVGALLGSAPNRRAFEWEEIGSGVFSAIVRSGLRGGADVDRDARISYRELASFVAAASREIPVARARPQMIAVPPAVDVDAPIVELAWIAPSRPLEGDLAGLGRFFVWNARGRWIAGGRFEREFTPLLLVPDEELFVDAETSSTAVKHRGVLDRALKSGLFAQPYGPAFHRGFVASGGIERNIAPEEDERSWVPIALYSAAGASALAGAIAGGFAIEAGVRAADTDLEREAHDAASRYRTAGITAIAALSVGVTLGLIAYLSD